LLSEIKYIFETKNSKILNLKGFMFKYCNNIKSLNILDAVLFLFLTYQVNGIRRRNEKLEYNIERKTI
jgi:hypothetical protein